MQVALRLPVGISGTTAKRQKRFIFFGFFVLIVSGCIPFQFTGTLAFFLCRVFAGMAAASWVSFTSLFLNWCGREKAGEASGTIYLAYNTGIFLAFIAGSFFYDRIGMRFFFLASAALALAGLGIFVKGGEEPAVQDRTEEKSPTVQQLLQVLRHLRLIHYSVMSALLQAVIFSTALAFVFNYAQRIGAGGFELGMMSVTLSLAGIVTTLGIGAGVTSRIPDKALIGGSFILLGLYSAVVPVATKVWPLYLLQAMAGVGRAVASSMIMASAVKEFSDEERSMAMGAYQTIYSFGITLGPVLMGLLIDTYGYERAFLSIACVCCAAAVLELIRKRWEEKTV